LDYHLILGNSTNQQQSADIVLNRFDIGYQEYLSILGILPLAKQKPLEEKKKVEALKSEGEQKQ